MTIYTFPDITPSTSSWELVTNTKSFSSPLTGAVQTTIRKGSYWRVTMTFNNLSGNDRSIMQAYLAKLNGKLHRMLLHDHSFTRRGTGTDTGLVAAASQTGTSLACTGAPASYNNYAYAGDYIRVNNELHMIVNDSANSEADNYDTNASGNVTFTISPPIRTTTSAGDPVDLVVPVSGVFMLDSQTSWDTRPGIVSNFTIEAFEDILA